VRGFDLPHYCSVCLIVDDSHVQRHPPTAPARIGNGLRVSFVAELVAYRWGLIAF
jgi:hypothetical protein